MAYAPPPPQPPGPPYPPPGYGHIPAAGPWQPGYPPGPPQHGQATQPGAGRGDTESLALLALLILFHIFANLYWLWADHHPIQLDEAHHINRSIACFESVLDPGEGGLFERLIGILDLQSPYPPFPHLVGAVLIRLLGYDPDRVALSGTVALAVLLVGVYVLARQRLTAKSAFLACLFTSLSPMIFGFSRLHGPELFLAAVTIWALAVLLKSDFLQQSGWAALFGLLAGMAMLIKQTAFVYLLVPAIAWMLLGLGRALLPKRFPGEASRGGIIRRTVFNLFIAGLVALGTCSWWYFRHMEYQYVWWSTQRDAPAGVLQAPLADMVSRTLPEPPQSPERHIALDPAISFQPMQRQEQESPPASLPAVQPKGEDTVPEKEETIRGIWTTWGNALKHASLYYPLAALSTLAFLPLAFLVLLGLPALGLRRNRTQMISLLLTWAVGGGLLLTALFVIRSPRFLLPVVPAFAILATLALDAVPRLRLRSVMFAAAFFLMFLQYVNMTFLPLGPLRSLAIPLPLESPAFPAFRLEIPVFRDHIDTGHYRVHAPWRTSDEVAALYERLCAYEKERHENAGAGSAAWYQVVSNVPGTLGVDFYARHYAPAPNPFRPPSVSEDVLPKRPFARVKEVVSEPEHAQPELAQAEYVWLIPGGGEDAVETLEEWLVYLHQQRFKPILQTDFSGYGSMPDGPVVILADTRFPAFSRELTLFGLYDLLLNDGTLWTLPEEDRKTAADLFSGKIAQFTQYKPLAPQVGMLGLSVEPLTTDIWLLYLVLQSRQRVAAPLHVHLRGHVHEEDRVRDFDARQALQEIRWDFMPYPPAQNWRENGVVILSRPIVAKPLRYRLTVALTPPDVPATERDTATTDWILFAPRQP